MKIVLVTILAGILASTCRVIFLELITKLRAAHVDIIKAVGTLYHGEYGHVLLRGFGAHYFFGIISAFIYLILLGTIQPSTVLSSAGFGALIGFFHGCVVSFTLTVVVDEDHPIQQFRTYGYEVVLYQWIAQILYGIVLGAVLGTVHPKFF